MGAFKAGALCLLCLWIVQSVKDEDDRIDLNAPRRKGSTCTKNSQCGNSKCGRMGDGEDMICCHYGMFSGSWWRDYCGDLKYGDHCTNSDQCEGDLYCQSGECYLYEVQVQREKMANAKRDKAVLRRKCEPLADFAKRRLESELDHANNRIGTALKRASDDAAKAAAAFAKGSKLAKAGVGTRIAAGFASLIPVAGPALNAIGTAVGASLHYAAENCQAQAESARHNETKALMEGLAARIDKNSAKLDALIAGQQGAITEIKKYHHSNTIYEVGSTVLLMKDRIIEIRDDYAAFMDTDHPAMSEEQMGVFGNYLDRVDPKINELAKAFVKAQFIASKADEYLGKLGGCWTDVTPDMSQGLIDIKVKTQEAIADLRKGPGIVADMEVGWTDYYADWRRQKHADEAAVQREKEATLRAKAAARVQHREDMKARSLSTDVVNCAIAGTEWGLDDGENYVKQCKELKTEEDCRKRCTSNYKLFVGTRYFKCKWVAGNEEGRKCTSHSRHKSFQQECALATCKGK